MGHSFYAPSSMPAREVCLHFDGSAKGSEYSDRGTLLHDACADLLIGRPIRPEVAEQMDDADLSQVEWAVSSLDAFAQFATCKAIYPEHQISYVTDDFYNVEGTGDAVIVDGNNRLIIADWKFGLVKNHEAQLITYAAGAMQELGFDSCVCIILYPMTKSFTRFEITLDDASKRVDSLVTMINNRDNAPHVPSEYWCHFCEHFTDGNCPAVTEMQRLLLPAEVATALYESGAGMNIESAPVEKIEILYEALTILGKLQDAVKDELKRRIIDGKGGERYRMTAGRTTERIVSNLALAIEADIPLTEFVKVAKISKTAAMELIYGDEAGTVKAKKEWEAKYSQFCEKSTGSGSLIKNK